MPTHQDLILDQFSKQVVPFATAPGIKDEEALKLVVDFTGVTADDTVLDVACGPGLIVCAFAPHVRHVTGIDIVPAMIDHARGLQQQKGLMNITWQVGTVQPLPYPDASFSIVTSRYAFHHFMDPEGVLTEMKRVCKPGGKVVVIDAAISPDPAKAAAYNRAEKLRDPSHTRALALVEFELLFKWVELPAPRKTSYKVESDLDDALQRSFPNSGDADKLRQMLMESLDDDGLGVDARRENGKIRFAYPIAVLVAEK
ncbi:MAG: class I SAM-dependent methyltransferase [Deltaproteobacteria bacterium]|nr:class I SAM-dependent methyltransferase [Deltaproteobacteria bacterium]